MKIAISRASGSPSYERYAPWLQAADAGVEIIDMHSCTPEQAAEQLALCDGLVLSGGPDVDPSRYDAEHRRGLCLSIDADRDAREMALIEAARDLKMPVLGICRGAQILNVAYGGTLFADLPTERPSTTEHRQIDAVDAEHAVSVEPGSILRRISRAMDGTVNSAHHQGVEHLAPLFTPSVVGDDGLIEAFEWGDAALGGKPFLLAVQWHPERMEYSNPFSLPIAEHFIHEAHAYRLLVKPRP
ncbi:MAG TPA: peptidase C26 [Bacteroidetes bacterium]|nr:peptidase C26 [Bacteroidota bacterium]